MTRRLTSKRLSGKRGTVVLIVVVALVFAAAALLVFIERASTDMMVEVRGSDAGRLRNEAYSAMETTLSVLAEWKEVQSDLHHPSEGWGNPLEFAGYEPAEGRKVDVSFVDESGRIPLTQATDQSLLNIFKSWGMKQGDAEKLVDGVMGWMHKDHVGTSTLMGDSYDSGALPFHAPYRVLRSFTELATIAGARELLYDEKGQPNEYWQHFADAFSLYDYKSPNINAAVPEVLANQGTIDDGMRRQLSNYLDGTGAYQSRGKGYFRSSADVEALLGNHLAAGSYDTVIRALRIIVTVTEGNSRYTLSALVAPPGGATIPVQKDEDKADAVKDSTDPAKEGTAATQADAADPKKNLKYPFAVLEISENDISRKEP